MQKAEHVKILVVGDIMLDKYVVGNVSRISPEAPVPVVNVLNEYHTLGGCGNVVRNIREVGGQVDCLSAIGSGKNGKIISDELAKIDAGNILFHGSKKTTVKERVIADHRQVQMLRLDREVTKNIDYKFPIEILNTLDKKNYDMIIVSDYAKGMVTYELMKYLKAQFPDKIIVDPKPEHGIMYDNVLMITPNETEWASMMFSSAYNLKNVKYILKTLGRKGMELVANTKEDESWKIEAEPVDIYNVSGAGDTVVAIMAVCISMGWNILDSAYIANKCAGYVVTQPGTTVVPKDKFLTIIENYLTF